MSLKAKLISTISAFVLILTIVIVAVWAATQANVSLGGTINFQATNVYAKVSGTVTGMDSNPTLPPLIFSVGEEASQETVIEQWNNLDLVFKTSGTPIEIEVTVENLSDERSLGVSIQNQIASIENIDISITSGGEASTSATLSPSTGSGTSTVTFLVTVSLQNPNVSVTDALYDILIKLTDESQMKQINVYSSSDLISVTGGGLYQIGDVVTIECNMEEAYENNFIPMYLAINSFDGPIVATSDRPMDFKGQLSLTIVIEEDTPTSYYLMNYNLQEMVPNENYFEYLDTETNYQYLLFKTGEQNIALLMNGVINSEAELEVPNTCSYNGEQFKVVYAQFNGGSEFASLTRLTIPENLVYLDLRLDATGVVNLQEIIVDSNNPVFEDRGINGIFNKFSKSLFRGCNSTIIPEDIREIEDSAFRDCSNLAEISINGNISTLDSSAFSGCSNLTKLTLGSNVTSLPDSLFGTNNLTNLTEIVVEAGSTLSAALPTYGTWVKDGGSETVTNFSGAGTYTRTDI